MIFAIYDTETLHVTGWMDGRGITLAQVNAGLVDGRAALEVSERIAVPCRVDGDNLVPLPVDELAILARQARMQRNWLLQASDWTQVADAPVNQAAWADYRQELREVPQQPGFPQNINWPEIPA
jgi:hypothetical protein